MKASTYLKRYIRADNEIKRLRARLDVLQRQETITGVQGVIYEHERVQRSRRNGAAFELSSIERIDEEKELEAAICELENIKRLIYAQIAAMPDERYKTLLEARYIRGENVYKAAERLNYSEHTIEHEGRSALRAFYCRYAEQIKAAGSSSDK